LKTLKKSILLSCLVVLSACSTKKLPYTPLDFPRYEWSFNQSGEVLVNYDVDIDGRVQNVRFVEAKPNALFNGYVKRKMLDDWRFEKGNPRTNLEKKIYFNK